ncbi:MAG: carbon-nitrogen hydrolase family protein [Acidobacteriia bacterium]|nr:carbon-nitrogen hydrolase family protein [Terriglobia bacterium]
MQHDISRRNLIKGAVMAGAAAVIVRPGRAQTPAKTVRVAAVQMHATLGEVDANLENAERWVRLALREGARWVVLPEFFTTGIAHHPTKLLNAYRPLDGAPMQLLKRLAHEGNAYIAGSFLARSGADVFNTFVLASPAGDVYTHDKDFPTTDIESTVYAGGEDDEFVKEVSRQATVASKQPVPSRPQNIKSAVFALPNGMNAGAALCWEQCRYRTARRLTGRVDLVLAASGWPFVSQNVSRANQAAGRGVLDGGEAIRETPRRLARLVGAPVVHASLVGDTWNSAGSVLGGEAVLRFSGESQVADAHGRTLSRRGYAEGEGLVIAEIETGRVEPSESIPSDAFWTPEVSLPNQQVWAVSGAAGRETYLHTTRPHRNG